MSKEFKSVEQTSDIAALNSASVDMTVTARTVTATGATTGTIADGTTGYIQVTSDNANKILILPAPVVGLVLGVVVGANGCELRTSDPVNISLNGGSGEGKELALAATTLTYVKCTSTTSWTAVTLVGTGITSVTQNAAD